MLSINGRPSRIAAPARPLSIGNSKSSSDGSKPKARDAAEEPALAVEEVAVGSIGVEQVGELVGEPLEDDGKVELAAEHVSRTEQGACWASRSSFSAQRLLERDAGTQPLEREGRLGGERLHHGEVVRRKDTARVSVATEMTAVTRSSSRSGTKAALFAPTASTRRRLTTPESAAS